MRRRTANRGCCVASCELARMCWFVGNRRGCIVEFGFRLATAAALTNLPSSDFTASTVSYKSDRSLPSFFSFEDFVCERDMLQMDVRDHFSNCLNLYCSMTPCFLDLTHFSGLGSLKVHPSVHLRSKLFIKGKRAHREKCSVS